MPDANDLELMQEYAGRNSEPAFAELVHRHINLVYSVALRFTGDSGDAQDVTQAVFIILAQKAAGLRHRTSLTGWLYETTRLTARQSLRTRFRRQAREQEAYMQSTLNDSNPDGAWQQLAPLLEEAMARLNEKERTLLALRFFENKTGAETAALLGIQEWAAHKRAERAMEKLRAFFTQRGIVLPAAVMTAAISANSVQAAPVGLAVTVTAAAAKGAAATTSTLTLVKGALKLMAWTKTQTAIVAGAAVILATGASTVVVEKVVAHQMEATGIPQFDNPTFKTATGTYSLENLDLNKLPPLFILRKTRFPMLDGISSNEGNNRIVSLNAPAKFLLTFAYPFTVSRMIVPDDLPSENFDLFLTIQNYPRERLQQELKKRLGLVAHRETRPVDVLILKVSNPIAAGIVLGKTSDAAHSVINIDMSAHKTTGVHMPFASLATFVENILGKPVLNQTGLDKQFYDFQLDWTPQAGESDADALKRALCDQLGIDVVPGRSPVEMLVVEKAK